METDRTGQTLGAEQAGAQGPGQSGRVVRGPRPDLGIWCVTGWAVALKGEQWDPTVCTGPSERMGVALNEVWDTGGVAAL